MSLADFNNETTITVNGEPVTVPRRLFEYDGTWWATCPLCGIRIDEGERFFFRGDYFCSESHLRLYYDDTWDLPMTATATPKLAFDEQSHVYWIDDREVPSVTTIIDAVCPDMFAHVRDSEFYMERGSRIHKAVHYALVDDLDEESLDEMTAGCIAAARKCLDDLRAVPIHLEHRVYSLIYRYAGTLDCIALDERGRTVLLDWKSGRPTKAIGPQTAAYALAYREMTGAVVDLRYGVHLKADGKYSLTEAKDRNDTDLFRSMLQLWNWRKN